MPGAASPRMMVSRQARPSGPGRASAFNALAMATTDQTVIEDHRLHWVDAPWILDGFLYLPEAQVDRIAQFHNGHTQIKWPLHIYKMKLE